MAHIEKRKTTSGKVRYRAQVKINGYAPISATFDKKTDADQWAKEKERTIRRQQLAIRDRCLFKQGPSVDFNKRESFYQCGVYLLFQEDVVVYVGHSSHVLQRLMAHSRTKEFDSFLILQCPQERMLEIERTLISKYDPPYNRQ